MTRAGALPAALEPILTDEDRAVWASWERAALVHARTQAHRRLVERSRAAVLEALALPGVVRPSVSWSAGKDSTAMAHLVCVTAGAAAGVELVSEKDDLDYPGEREYVERYAAAWGARLKILTPAVSPREWIATRAAREEIVCCDDIHSRAAGLSKACFYRLMEEDNAGRGLVMLGLRAEESNIREALANRALGQRREAREAGRAHPASGLTYWHEGAAQWRAVPVARWRGLDVFAYLLAHDVEPLHVYRCVAFMHADRPWMIRKSWWLPGGAAGRYGQVAWLKRYYPSLYRQLRTWMSEAALLT